MPAVAARESRKQRIALEFERQLLAELRICRAAESSRECPLTSGQRVLGEDAAQAVRQHRGDLDRMDLADEARCAVDMHGLEIGAAADRLARFTAGLLEQHGKNAAGAGTG